VKELVITEWPNSNWTEVHTRALLLICQQCKVEKITFTPIWGPIDLAKLATLAPPKFVFPSRVRYIDAAYKNEIVPLITKLLPLVRVSNITWSFGFLPYDVTVGTICYDVMLALESENVFDTNYTIRDMAFRNGKGLAGLDDDQYRLQGIMSNWLYRNRRIFRRCKKTTTVLLGLIRRKTPSLFSLAGRDAMSIVIAMVWETRDTKVWETWKKCGSAI